jgi:hypothetical protein
VLRHPLAIECAVYRKRALTDKELEDAGLAPAGSATPNPASGEADAEFEFDDLGDASILLIGASTKLDASSRPLVEAQIECVAEPGAEGHFVAMPGDFVAVLPGLGISIVYEVDSIISDSDVPPYTRRYGLSPRADLHQLTPALDV